MARARSPLFSLEARGKIAGLRASLRPGVGQVVALPPAPPPPPSPKLLLAQQRHAALTALWRIIPYPWLRDFDWDRSRRYHPRPGTAYSEFLHDHLGPLTLAPVSTVHTPVVTKQVIAGRIVFACYILTHLGLVQVDYGPTPHYPSRTARMFLWAADLYLGNYPDEWPGKHVWARFRSVQPFGNVTIGWSGLARSNVSG